MSNCFIYGLVDPRTKLVRYIGLTSIGMKRPHQHSPTRGGALLRAWLRELRDHDISREIVVLALSASDALKRDERWWIAYGRASGWPLTNLTDGGDGMLNPHPSTRARIAAWWASPAGLAKRERLAAMIRARPRKAGPRRPRRSRASGRGRSISTEQRAFLSRIAKERQADPAVRAVIGARTRARLAEPEARAAHAAANKARWTPELRAAVGAKAKARQADPEVRKAIGDRVRAFHAAKKAA